MNALRRIVVDLGDASTNNDQRANLSELSQSLLELLTTKQPGQRG